PSGPRATSCSAHRAGLNVPLVQPGIVWKVGENGVFTTHPAKNGTPERFLIFRKYRFAVGLREDPPAKFDLLRELAGSPTRIAEKEAKLATIPLPRLNDLLNSLEVASPVHAIHNVHSFRQANSNPVEHVKRILLNGPDQRQGLGIVRHLLQHVTEAQRQFPVQDQPETTFHIVLTYENYRSSEIGIIRERR